MIQLLCKKRFRFKNPGAEMIKSETVGGGKDKQEVQVESGARFEQVYFEVTPGVLTAAPDWVRHDKIFAWGVADGDILEVTTKSPAQAEAAQQQADNTRKAEEEAHAEAEAKKKEQLGKLSKVELLKYASENYELELSPSLTKDAILSAISQAEKDAADEGDGE